MLVEFIGTTGSGKTTLLKSVRRRLTAATNTTTAADLVTALAGFRTVTQPTAQNVIQEVVGFPSFVVSLFQHGSFAALAIRLLVRKRPSPAVAFSDLRSLVRKLGVYRLVKRFGGDRIVLVDEGPLLAAHMFVRGQAGMTASEVARFAATVPLPDALVYVTAPAEAVLRRTRARPDPPREAMALEPADLREYARTSALTFDRLVACLNGDLPVLVVNNVDARAPWDGAVVDSAVRFILAHHRGLHSHGATLTASGSIVV